jgi:hypothetical protein
MALPHPPNTSQKVPINSAANRLDMLMGHLRSSRSLAGPSGIAARS